jgi:hypothetical protein
LDFGGLFLFFLGRESEKLKLEFPRFIARSIADTVEVFQTDYQRLPLPSGPKIPGGDCDTITGGPSVRPPSR